MKTEAFRDLLLLIVAAILISCASTKAHLDLAEATSKAGLNMHGVRLGIMPMQCYAADTGNIISDTIANNFIGTDIEVIERTYLAKIFEEQGFDLTVAKENLDYSRIGEICNLDYLLVGTVSTVTYSERFVRERAVNYVTGATVRIVSLATGEVVASANIKRTRRDKWHQPIIVGQALAAAITKELEGEK